ncbi:MAG: hypothetical protein ACRC14_04715 [Paracoccaceae bacterium]
MSKAPTPSTKSTAPIGAYATDGGGYAAYDASGRTWPVDQAAAEAMGIRTADPSLFPTLKVRK